MRSTSSPPGDTGPKAALSLAPEPPSETSEDRRAAARTRLVDAGEQLFAERGVHGVTIEEICELAGVTRGGFHANFSAKDDLVLEISERYYDRMLARVSEASLDDELTPGDLVKALIDAWADDPAERRLWYLVHTEFMIHAVRDPAAGRRFLRYQTRLRGRLVDMIEGALARRNVTLSVSSETLARTAIALLVAGTGQHLLEPRALGDGELAATIVPLVILGAAVPAGPSDA